MTWLFEKAGPANALPVEAFADGLFSSRASSAVLPLEFEGPVAASSKEEMAAEKAHSAEQAEAQERMRQVRTMVDAAREEATEEARAALELDCLVRLKAERARVTTVLAVFEKERERWFRQAERDVAELALAISRRVLGRELKTDPLMLRALALEAVSRVQGQSVVHVRVSPDHIADWRSIFTGCTDVEVIADASIANGECVIDTTFGRVELGVEVQLAELSERFREMVGEPRRVAVEEAVLAAEAA